ERRRSWWRRSRAEQPLGQLLAREVEVRSDIRENAAERPDTERVVVRHRHVVLRRYGRPAGWSEEIGANRPFVKVLSARYADDVTAVFSQEEDARRVWAVLPKRFARYGLTLHPEKTRLIAFRRPSGADRDATARPPSFDMLGFTHFWTRSLPGLLGHQAQDGA